MISLQIQTGSKYIEQLLLALLVAATVSCASTGTPRLSQRAVELVIEGKSSNVEIEALMGRPENRVTSDSVGVRNYVRRVFMDESLGVELPDDEYELWTYSKYRYVGLDPLLLPSHETSMICVLVIDSDNVCRKKYYKKEGGFEW